MKTQTLTGEKKLSLFGKIKDEIEWLQICPHERKGLRDTAGSVALLGGVLANAAICAYRGYAGLPIVDGNYGGQAGFFALALSGGLLGEIDNRGKFGGEVANTTLAFGLLGGLAYGAGLFTREAFK